jgi:hypothetical protein
VWRQKRVVPWLAVTILVIVASIVVDRVSLFVWEGRVRDFYARVKRDAPAFWMDGKRAIGWQPRNDADLDPRVAVSFQETSVRPDGVIVDSEKGLQLVFLPPALAWTTRLYPRYSLDRGSPIPPIMSYRYVITISKPTADHKTGVALSKGILQP